MTEGFISSASWPAPQGPTKKTALTEYDGGLDFTAATRKALKQIAQ
jgi:hypothetical protein